MILANIPSLVYNYAFLKMHTAKLQRVKRQWLSRIGGGEMDEYVDHREFLGQ